MKNVFLAASLAALAMPVVAQETGGAAEANSPANKLTVQQRQKHQKKRIAHGIQSGQLAAGEAASLERKEAGLNTEERDMRDNRGRLTSAHRAQLQHQQNRGSKAIDHDQHNTAMANTHSKSAGPRTPQQPRAAQLKTGHLTTRQAAHLKTKEASLHRQIHSDREQNGGKLAPQDRAPVDQQNKTTNQIRLKKHNARMF